MKTSELQGAALDWAVAKCEGPSMMAFFTRNEYAPSTDWEQGGPIIEREGITVELLRQHDGAYLWEGRLYIDYPDKTNKQSAWSTATISTPLVAAMRCYVASKLGDEVEIPEGLK